MKAPVSIFLIVFSLITLFAFGQKEENTRREKYEKALKMREELHRRLFDHLFRGSLANDDIFKDMDSLFEDALSNVDSNFLGPRSNNYEMAWSESKDGRTLLLAPKNKDQKLEINVEEGMIQIKGQNEEKTEYGTSVSSFSNAFSVPDDCDWKRVKILEKEGKILISFPYVTNKNIPEPQKKQTKDERFPLKPSQGDIEI